MTGPGTPMLLANDSDEGLTERLEYKSASGA